MELGTIVTAAVSGGLTLIGVLISNSTRQAVTDTKLENLTREVREHNNFARLVPVLEEKISGLTQRIDKLEKEHEHENHG